MTIYATNAFLTQPGRADELISRGSRRRDQDGDGLIDRVFSAPPSSYYPE
jgi:hypothetical protein